MSMRKTKVQSKAEISNVEAEVGVEAGVGAHVDQGQAPHQAQDHLPHLMGIGKEELDLLHHKKGK